MLSVGGRRSVAHGLAVRRSVSAARRHTQQHPAPALGRRLETCHWIAQHACCESEVFSREGKASSNDERERDVVLRSVSAMEDGKPLYAFQGLRQRAGKSRLDPAGRPGDQHAVSGVDPVAQRQAHHGLAVDAAAGASAPVINGCSPRLIPRPRCTPEPRFVTWLRGTRIQKRIPAL